MLQLPLKWLRQKTQKICIYTETEWWSKWGNVNHWRIWVKAMEEFFVRFMQLFGNSEIISKFSSYPPQKKSPNIENIQSWNFIHINAKTLPTSIFQESEKCVCGIKASICIIAKMTLKEKKKCRGQKRQNKRWQKKVIPQRSLFWTTRWGWDGRAACGQLSGAILGTYSKLRDLGARPGQGVRRWGSARPAGEKCVPDHPSSPFKLWWWPRVTGYLFIP